jgi:hypothetical protein
MARGWLGAVKGNVKMMLRGFKTASEEIEVDRDHSVTMGYHSRYVPKWSI